MVGIVISQALSTPSSWTNTSSNLNRDSREWLANGAATELLQHINTSSRPLGLLRVPQDLTSTYSALAIQDYNSGNSSWSKIVINGMQAYTERYGLYAGSDEINSDVIYWGIAFIYAYRTYRTQALLDLAVKAWNEAYAAGFITPDAAASGNGAGRNVTFSPVPPCTNDALAGGVFNVIRLSAYLYEQTADLAYKQAAQLSLDFTLNHMFNGSIIADTFRLSTCQLYPKQPRTINQAWFIEGLSIWANVTKNITLTLILEALVLNVTTFTGWSLPSGVISEDPDPTIEFSALKGVFIRGLAEARVRNPGTDLARYIEAYITVQFNSLLDHALSPAPNSSSYSTSWYGPPVSSFSAAGNIAALDVLNAVFSFVAPASSPGNSSSGNTTGTSGSGASGPRQSASTTSSSSNAATIAGGVVGAVVLLTAIATLVIWHRRRSRKHDDTTYVTQRERVAAGDVANAVEPFALRRPSPSAPLSKWQRFYADRRPANSASSSSPAVPAGSNSMRIQQNGNSLTLGMGPTQTTAVPRNSSGEANQQSTPTEAAAMTELTSFLRRLNNLVRGHQEELPPQYET
ncbi:hypothetical protein PENSPDRAFT_679577 [Peniophora sp. CONT]|nr:hypothetical protein PENSPDRAFT_679577 [Peniophora sp. CONT]